MTASKNIAGKTYGRIFKDVRLNAAGLPDFKDCQEASANFHARGAAFKLAFEQANDEADPIVAIGGYHNGGMRIGAASRGGMRPGSGHSYAVPSFPADPACADAPYCGGDLLGISSIDDANFPIAAPAAVRGTAVADLEVSSETADAFQPRAFFFEGRDASSPLYGVQALALQNVRISTEQQTVGSLNNNLIISDIFALTNEPLQVGWKAFKNIRGQTAVLTFANVIPGTTPDVFGALWGDALASTGEHYKLHGRHHVDPLTGGMPHKRR